MRRRQHGFTLIELMTVVSIIGVLALIGVPQFRGYVLDSRLSNAHPTLIEIATKMRMSMLERGQYCCASGDPVHEVNIINDLGVRVDEVGDFCFMIVCRDAAACPTTTAADFIAPQETGDPATEFEVWAVLRNATGTADITVPNDICKPDIGKRNPTGWVRDASSGSAGRQGQIVALRYPPPSNGLHSGTGQGGHRYNWDAGITKTHALNP